MEYGDIKIYERLENTSEQSKEPDSIITRKHQKGTLFFDKDIKTETNKSNVQNYNRTAARKKKRNDCRIKEMTSRIIIINRS